MLQRFHHADPELGVQGWLVYDDSRAPLAVGGCRVQHGLTVDRLATLASRMTLKERILGLNIDGAKCGLDLPPGSPLKARALERFIAFLRPHLEDRFSMGCDMGVRFSELERLAVGQGLRSIKQAVMRAQKLTDGDWAARVAVLDQPVGRMTVNERRAGHALAHAAITGSRHRGSAAQATYAVQGFGTLGRAAAYSLHEAGRTVVGIADKDGCLWDDDGLDVTAILALDEGASLPDAPVRGERADPRELFRRPVGTLLLAAKEDALCRDDAYALMADTIVIGANCGVAPPSLAILEDRGLLVVPDFVGGCGGSASMEALFGPAHVPTGAQVLDTVADMVIRLVDGLADEAHRGSATMTQAALARVRNTAAAPGLTPYGHSPLRLGAGRAGAKTVQVPGDGSLAVAGTDRWKG